MPDLFYKEMEAKIPSEPPGDICRSNHLSSQKTDDFQRFPICSHTVEKHQCQKYFYLPIFASILQSKYNTNWIKR